MGSAFKLLKEHQIDSFKIELKDGDEVRWTREITLTGGEQYLNFEIQDLGEITHLVWILDRGVGEDYVVLDNIDFSATTQITDTATAAFVWSYGMLLNNWNPETGLVPTNPETQVENLTVFKFQAV